jgi:hypothetical protein
VLDHSFASHSLQPSQDHAAPQDHSKFEVSHMDMPLQQNYQKADWQNLVDWVNSFDDSYCVLVNALPDDLRNGIVLSHLVGYIVCCEADREMIFDLLNYLDAEGALSQDKTKENFELAYNVLKCSQMYQDAKHLRFLADEDGKHGVSPALLASGAQLVEFLNGLKAIADSAAPKDKLHLDVRYTEDPASNVKESAEAPYSHSDMGSANNTGNLRPGSILQLSTIRDTATSTAFPVSKSDLTNKINQVAVAQRSREYELDSRLEEDEMARLEREEQELLKDLEDVDRVVQVARQESLTKRGVSEQVNLEQLRCLQIP